MSAEQRQQLKVEIYRSWQEVFNTPAWQDYVRWLSDQYSNTFNEIVKNPDQRNPHTSDDTLRGRLQMIGLLKSYVEMKLSEGQRAVETLAESST